MEEAKRIVFATNNGHKLREIRKIMGDSYTILSLKEIGCEEDIPETADTLEGNALIKALYVKEHYGYDCFADDTGLFVDALDGAPGVYSARYAGPGHDSAANMRRLLSEMQGISDRKAHFSTVIAYVRGSETVTVEGRVDGFIEEATRGENGFGYDPVFRPEGFDTTFAQMTDEQKNAVSHRGRAVEKFAKLLSAL